MKTNWLLAGVLGIVVSATAQTNEPVVQVKEYRADHLTNEIHLSGRGAPIFLRGTVIAVYKTRFRFLLYNPFNENDPNNWKEIAVQKYPNFDQLAADQKLEFVAERIGTIRAVMPDGTPAPGNVLELWEYYVKTPPPQPTPEEIAAAKAKKEQAAKTAAAKAYQGQSNAVLWLQPQATNGSANAQGSLGWHYLNGLGCETNRELGIYWLKKATAQGDIEASNHLARLKP
ncbi:MAG: hypothetical protein P4L87_14275 [Formivibrio sp.]|nr:hypothetical protein [Formivibrio sp.]